MKTILLTLIFGLMTLTSHGYLQSSKILENATTGTFPVYVAQDVLSKTVQVGQSFGVQKSNQNQEDIVPPINSKAPTTATVQQVKVVPIGPGSHFGTQPSSFIPSQFLGYNKPNSVRQAVSVNGKKEQLKLVNKLPPYTPSAQRRVDYEVSKDDSEAHLYGDDDGDDYSNYMSYKQQHYQENDDPYADLDQETREVPGLSGPGFVEEAPFDPLPPPPAPIKGSVDYILIPLVLIGLAGPIFVVLYVILGAFEAKLSPITRSLGGVDAYKPYLDNLMSSVGRALDKNECLDYAACQLGSFSNQMGYTNYPMLQTTLDSFTPTTYKRTVRKLFDSMKSSGGCSFKKCVTHPILQQYLND